MLKYEFHVTFTNNKKLFWFFPNHLKTQKLVLVHRLPKTKYTRFSRRTLVCWCWPFLTLCTISDYIHWSKYTSKWVWLNNGFCKRFSYICIHICVYIQRWILMFSKKSIKYPWKSPKLASWDGAPWLLIAAEHERKMSLSMFVSWNWIPFSSVCFLLGRTPSFSYLKQLLINDFHMGSTRTMLEDKGKVFRKDFMDKWNKRRKICERALVGT